MNEILDVARNSSRIAQRCRICLSDRTALAMVFKAVEAAQKSWQRLDADNQPVAKTDSRCEFRGRA